mmetsp:Transcript_12656/g.31183  ORF Transcript_12656/g.31183 Transcript_12656/m.31183 type:complete len:203 (+) Transcript_12656:16-624(+)
MGAGATHPDRVVYIAEAGRNVFWKDFAWGPTPGTSSTADTRGQQGTSSSGSAGDRSSGRGCSGSDEISSGGTPVGSVDERNNNAGSPHGSQRSFDMHSGSKSSSGSVTPPRGWLCIGPQSHAHSTCMVEVDKIPPGQSVGSAHHGTGKCVPCVYFSEADNVCRYGRLCEWCHSHEHRSARRPRGGARARKKRQAQLLKAQFQ